MPDLSGEYLNALLLRLRGLSTNVTKQEAITELRSLDKTRLTAVLHELIAITENEHLKTLAIEAFYWMDAQTAIPILIEYLKHPDESIRYEAAGILGDCGNPDAANGLQHVAMTDTSPEVRHIAIFSLGKVGTPANFPALAHIRETDDAVTATGHTMTDVADNATKRIQSRYNLQ